MVESSVPTGSDPTKSEFKGTTQGRYFSNKQHLIQLWSLCPRDGAPPTQKGLELQGGDPGGISASQLTSPPPASPKQQVVCVKGARRPGPGSLRLRARGTGLPGETGTLRRPGKCLTRHRSSGEEGASGEPETAEGCAERNHTSH